MKNKYYLVAFTGFILSALSLVSYAQTTWQKAYASPNPFFSGITATADGGYLASGYIDADPQNHESTMLLVKLKANGDTAWTRLYTNGTDYTDALVSIERPGGGFMTSGVAFNPQDGPRMTLMKTNSVGNVLMARSFEIANGFFLPTDILRSTQDSFLHVAYMQDFVTGSLNAAIASTDTNGNLAWAKSYFYNSAVFTFLNNGIKTADGSVYACGSTFETVNFTPQEQFVMKLNAAGDVQWLKTYEAAGNMNVGYAGHVIPTTDGKILFSYGFASSDTAGLMVHKLDTSGAIIWAKKILGENSQDVVGASAMQANDGGYIISGTNNNAPDFQAWIVKLNATGNTLWTKAYGDTYQYNLARGIINANGELIFAGSVTHNSQTSALAFKTDNLGNSSCQLKAQNFFNQVANVTVTNRTVTQQPLALTVNNITLTTDYSSEMEDLCSSTGIDDIKEKVSLSIYPNPASTSVTIQYDLEAAGTVSLNIYNATGALAGSIVANEQKTAGIHRQIIDVSNYAKGVYYCILKTGEEQMTKKIVVQ